MVNFKFNIGQFVTVSTGGRTFVGEVSEKVYTETREGVFIDYTIDIELNYPPYIEQRTYDEGDLEVLL